MPTTTTIIAILVIVAVIVVFTRRREVKPTMGSTETKITQRLRLPPQEARKSIERQIAVLAKRNPDKSREWYLKKILLDLERDRH